MRKYSGPDAAVYDWRRCGERLMVAKTLNPIAEQGPAKFAIPTMRVPARCKSGCPAGRISFNRSGDAVCSECKQAWPIAFIFSNDVTLGSRVDRRDDDLSVFTTLTHIIGRLPLWELRLYVQLYLFESVGGYDEIAEEAQRRWKLSKPCVCDWARCRKDSNGSRICLMCGLKKAPTDWIVRDTIRLARMRLQVALVNAGLMDRSETASI